MHAISPSTLPRSAILRSGRSGRRWSPGSGSITRTASRSTPRTISSGSASWRTSPTGAGTAIASSFPPISTSTRPTSVSSGPPAPSAPSRGRRRKRAPTPGRWTRCTPRRSRPGAPRPPSSTSSAGCTRSLRLSYYTDMLRGLKARHPGVHIKALTAVEIAHLARIEKLSERDVLLALQEAGLTSLPGGGAEVFSTAVRATIAERKLTGEEWIRVHRTAHELGIPDQLHDALRPHRNRRRPAGAPGHAARAAGRDRRLPDLHPAGLPPRPQRTGRGARPGGHRHHRLRGPQEHRRRAALSGQRAARQDPLADGHAGALPDRAQLRLRRRGRHRGLRAGVPRGWRAHPDGHAVSPAGGVDPQRRAPTGGAQQPLPGGARRVRRSAARARPPRRSPADARCRWCTPHETRPHPLDQLLSRSRAPSTAGSSGYRPTWSPAPPPSSTTCSPPANST